MLSRLGRARSWSSRLKLNFRAVWDPAKMEGLKITTKLVVMGPRTGRGHS